MIGLVLAAIVMSELEAPSDDEKIVAARTYMECLIGQAESLDDGTSDASTVAEAIAPNCGAELADMKDVYSRGASTQVSALIGQRLDEGQRAQSVKAVLTVRAIRRDQDARQRAAPPPPARRPTGRAAPRPAAAPEAEPEVETAR